MIRVYPDLNALSRRAAELFAEESQIAIKTRGRFSVALAGGSTPRQTYELLALPPFRDAIDWGRVHFFWGDERCVPLDHPLSNARMVRQALLERVPVIASQVHPMVCAAQPEGFAGEYEALLHSFFAGGLPRFDLVFLGLGENGHTASLFPDSPVLNEQKRWVCEVHVPQQEIYRVTLTAPLINQADVVAFLVSGQAKARVLCEVLEGPRDPMRLPAQLIQPEPRGGKLYWLLDEESAACLTRLPSGTAP